MHDWNHDGRIDAQDSFIDYQVFNEVTNHDPNSAGDNDEYEFFKHMERRSAKPAQTTPSAGEIIFYIIAVIIAAVIFVR